MCVCFTHLLCGVRRKLHLSPYNKRVRQKWSREKKKKKSKPKIWKELGREFEVVNASLPNFPGSRWYWREIKMKCLVLLICAVGMGISNICITFGWDNEEIAVCSLKPSWDLGIAAEGTRYPKGVGDIFRFAEHRVFQTGDWQVVAGWKNVSPKPPTRSKDRIFLQCSKGRFVGLESHLSRFVTPPFSHLIFILHTPGLSGVFFAALAWPPLPLSHHRSTKPSDCLGWQSLR